MHTLTNQLRIYRRSTARGINMLLFRFRLSRSAFVREREREEREAAEKKRRRGATIITLLLPTFTHCNVQCTGKKENQ